MMEDDGRSAASGANPDPDDGVDADTDNGGCRRCLQRRERPNPGVQLAATGRLPDDYLK